MLLTIDIGNTNVVWGLIEDSTLRGHWRLATESRRTDNEYGILLLNLLNNAAESMEAKKGGTLTVTTRVAPFGQGVRVVIADTGVGISEENRAKLFTPFFTTKPVGKGTGWGLAIVYGIVKMHHGQIQVQSLL